MRIFTLPNVVSAGRLCAGPVIIYALGFHWNPFPGLFNDYRTPALLLCGAAALSDLVDGWLAKLPGQRSDLGSKLDPLADVVILPCIAISLFCYYGLTLYTMAVYGLPTVITLVYAVRVTVMRWKGQVLESSWNAKWKTAWLFVSMMLLLTAIRLDGSLWAWVAEIPGILIGWRAALHTSTVLSNYRRRAEHAI